MILHVVSPTEVRLYLRLDEEREREYIAVVRAELPDFDFGKFMSYEKFCLELQSKFIENTDRDGVFAFQTSCRPTYRSRT